jgi:hypothetical protein
MEFVFCYIYGIGYRFNLHLLYETTLIILIFRYMNKFLVLYDANVGLSGRAV